ncbi:hypothetical protein PENTCL1PPCAC_21142, partial [Pristionchus entomophagus]
EVSHRKVRGAAADAARPVNVNDLIILLVADGEGRGSACEEGVHLSEHHSHSLDFALSLATLATRTASTLAELQRTTDSEGHREITVDHLHPVATVTAHQFRLE